MSNQDAGAGILLSVRPRFAEAIMTGDKDVELRRQPVGARPGDLIVLYSSSPVMAAVGWARVQEVLTSQVATLWATHGQRTGVSHEEYLSYFEGAASAHGLVLERPHRLEAPVPLRVLRSEFGVQPPQSWRYLPRKLGQALPAMA